MRGRRADAAAGRPAQAQLNGSHTLGDFGVKSGSQPAPGFYAALFYLHYGTDTIKDADGNTVRLAPERSEQPRRLGHRSDGLVREQGQGPGCELRRHAWCFPSRTRRSKRRRSSSARTVDTGFADMLVRPVDLGWHTPHADIAAGLPALHAHGPLRARAATTTSARACGRYEPFLGTTVYFDEKKTFSLATTAYWEIHGTKKDSDVKVGQILTLEGGLGKSFLGGGLIIGAAYYAQWKVTKDQLRAVRAPGRRRNRDRLPATSTRCSASGRT